MAVVVVVDATVLDGEVFVWWMELMLTPVSTRESTVALTMIRTATFVTLSSSP